MGLFTSNKKKNLDWKNITSEQEIDDVLSQNEWVLIFKHSTRCAISSMALSRFESEWSVNDENCTLAFIDLIKDRSASNYCAKKTGVVHQSPQIILIKNNEVKNHASHNNIDASNIKNIILSDEN